MGGIPAPIAFAEHARDPEQRAQMEESARTGKCVFCRDSGFDPVKNVVIEEGEHWFFWQNPYPYPHHSLHFVFATVKHVTDIRELPSEAFAELFMMVQQVFTDHNIPGGAIVMRVGANKFNAGTIAHLHVHLQVPDNTGPALAVFAKDDVFAAFLGMISPHNARRREQEAAFLAMMGQSQ